MPEAGGETQFFRARHIGIDCSRAKPCVAHPTPDEIERHACLQRGDAKAMPQTTGEACGPKTWASIMTCLMARHAVYYRNRKKIYLLVAFQCPQRALLREIANLCDRYCGSLYRLDIACDAIWDLNMAPQEQFRFIKEPSAGYHFGSCPGSP
jgi:hypothetical protein